MENQELIELIFAAMEQPLPAFSNTQPALITECGIAGTSHFMTFMNIRDFYCSEDPLNNNAFFEWNFIMMCLLICELGGSEELGACDAA